MARYTRPSVGWARSVDDLRAALRGISSKETQAKILKDAVEAACKPILVAAKRFAKRSERTGALRDSLTIKTVGYPASGRALGLVGPDRKYRVKGKVVGALGSLFGASKGELRRPANYAHLVEYGHVIAKGGNLRDKHDLTLVLTGRFSAKGKEYRRWKRGAVIAKATGTASGFVPAKPFLRPAEITTRSQQAAAFEQAVARGLDRALKKYNKAAGTTVRYKRAA